jgi:hypothetical protein
MTQTLKKTFLAFAACAAFASAAPAAAQDYSSPDYRAYMPSMQSAVSGYFNTLGIKKDQAKEGLVIPWVVIDASPLPVDKSWLGTTADATAVGRVHGYLVATGKQSAGCPVFKAFGSDERTASSLTGVWSLNLPKPVAICPR